MDLGHYQVRIHDVGITTVLPFIVLNFILLNTTVEPIT